MMSERFSSRTLVQSAGGVMPLCGLRTRAELAAAEICPQVWDSPVSLEWGRDLFPSLAEFFQAAASADHAVANWLD
ncbi:hypothetical protein [Streptomyces sp. NPDC102409]|uniref:hypothetical protein n=1 Tax=Streptomyces sp. NPDC102409 TaxID=3366172 RepID=UPI00380A89A9